MNNNVTAIVLFAEDYLESDKMVTLFSSEGEVFKAVMKGVKKQGAKLKFAAQPFSFCSFDVAKKGNRYTVTGASVIEELFSVTDYDSYTYGCAMLEAAYRVCCYAANPQIFVLLLRKLKELIYRNNNSKIVLTSFFQGCIHKSGFLYEYSPFDGKPTTVMQLLTLTNRGVADIDANEELVDLTLARIYKRFCEIFECNLKSMSVL